MTRDDALERHREYVRRLRRGGELCLWAQDGIGGWVLCRVLEVYRGHRLATVEDPRGRICLTSTAVFAIPIVDAAGGVTGS